MILNSPCLSLQASFSHPCDFMTSLNFILFKQTFLSWPKNISFIFSLYQRDSSLIWTWICPLITSYSFLSPQPRSFSSFSFAPTQTPKTSSFHTNHFRLPPPNHSNVLHVWSHWKFSKSLVLER
jgi:hypothetical protein